jgi:hypothetical protein
MLARNNGFAGIVIYKASHRAGRGVYAAAA